MTDVDDALAEAWRTSWSRLVGLLIGQYQRPDLAEDAVGDAFESAARHWPSSGVPANTGAWLLTAARRRVLDRLRTEAVHRRKEPLMIVDDEMRAAAAAAESLDDGAHVADEQLRLIFACSHPALAADDRVALTLRFVVGLTTAEIARLMLVQDTAMAARLTRAKKRLASSGIPFAVPPAEQLDSRLEVVAPVLYLMFTSAYQPGVGPVTLRVDLGDEAIRLVRQLDVLLPARAVLRPLLALMLLQHSRRDARLTATGELILLPDQDRSLWHTAEIAEALTLLSASQRPGLPAVPPSADPPSARVAGSSSHRGLHPAVRRGTRDSSGDAFDPARREAIDPPRRDAVARREAIDPPRRDAVARREAIDPATRDAIDPARREAIDPATRDAIDPARRDAIDPARREGAARTDDSAPAGEPVVSILAREYRLQALIAAEHATAATAQDTDWAAICRLYEELESLTGSPVVRLARAVATAEDAGPRAGLALLVGLDDALPRHHRLPAVRAELLTRAGDPAAAAAQYRRALALVTNDAERTHLEARLTSLHP